MNPADVAGLNVAARDAPRFESRTKKSDPEEFHTGTSVPVVDVVSYVASERREWDPHAQKASHVYSVLERYTTDAVR